MDLGAIGITCARLWQAERLVSFGIRDILIANEIAGEAPVARFVELAREFIKLAHMRDHHLDRVPAMRRRLDVVAVVGIELRQYVVYRIVEPRIADGQQISSRLHRRRANCCRAFGTRPKVRRRESVRGPRLHHRVRSLR